VKLYSLRRWMEARKIEIVSVDDGKLIVSAPTGTMADSVLKVLLNHKKQLIADYMQAPIQKVMYNI